MEKIDQVVARSLQGLSVEESPQPQENTKDESPSWSSEMVSRYLKHFHIEDDAIDASLICMDTAEKLCRSMEDNKRGLFLHGPQGRGKTTIAAAILRYEISRRLNNMGPYKSIQFMFIPDLLIELQSCFAHGSEKMPGDVIDRVSEYDFLILDGAGEGGKPSEFVIGSMGTIIHHREGQRKTKRTIITSNYSIQELGERMDARITSRIAGMCDEIPFTGIDRRLSR